MSGEWMGYAAATLTTASFLPQAAKTIRSRIVLGSWPMVAANAITFVLAATILALKLRYG